MATQYNCEDFMEFQESLKKMRELDDKIIYRLNTSIPTESFKGQVSPESTCEELYRELNVAHKGRQVAIKQCISLAENCVGNLRKQREQNQNDVGVNKSFKAEQRKLRVLESELNVEEIVKQRTDKAFKERCRIFFKADRLL